MLFCDFTRSIISLGRRVKTKTRAGFPTRVFSIGRLRESIRDRYDAGWALRLAAQVRWFGDFVAELEVAVFGLNHTAKARISGRAPRLDAHD